MKRCPLLTQSFTGTVEAIGDDQMTIQFQLNGEPVLHQLSLQGMSDNDDLAGLAKGSKVRVQLSVFTIPEPPTPPPSDEDRRRWAEELANDIPYRTQDTTAPEV